MYSVCETWKWGEVVKVDVGGRVIFMVVDGVVGKVKVLREGWGRVMKGG